MTSLPEPPGADALAELPVTVWAAHQPLWRVHLERHASVHFAVDAGGRFNPPSSEAGYGTWYLSTHPRAAFVEVFGRVRVIRRTQIHQRVLAQVLLPSDVRLADLTHPTVIGRYGITNELSVGSEAIYPLAQRWSHALWLAGFGGIHYASRHDPSLESRSIALFGKPGEEALFADCATIRPLDDVADEIAERFGLLIVSGHSL